MKVLIFQILLLLWINQTYSQLKSPYWQMPIFIEDGNGERDTVYVGLDSLAKVQYSDFDSLFEEYIEYDTTKFSVYIDGGITINFKNYGRKTMVKFPGKELRASFKFINGTFPLTFTWPIDSLNSPHYPIDLVPPYSNKTKVWWRNDIAEIFPNPNPPCFNGGTYTITNDPAFIPSSSYECHVNKLDSLIVTSLDNSIYFPDEGGGATLVDLQFVPITIPLLTGRIENKREGKIKVYPNPISDYLKISNELDEELHCIVYDMLGRKILEQPIMKLKETLINIPKTVGDIIQVRLYNETVNFSETIYLIK